MDWKRKLTSRKFWSAVATFIAMLVMACRGEAELAERITALVMAGGTVIAYIIGEGMTDAASVEQTYYIPEAVPTLDTEDEDE